MTHVPGVAAQAIDTTGAGDMFAAGVLFETIEKVSPQIRQPRRRRITRESIGEGGASRFHCRFGRRKVRLPGPETENLPTLRLQLFDTTSHPHRRRLPHLTQARSKLHEGRMVSSQLDPQGQRTQ